MDHFNHTSVTYPYSMQQSLGFRRYCPVTTSLLGQLTTGGGCGFGQNSIQVAYGEYLERTFFTLDVKADKKGLLSAYNSPEVTASLIAMIDQLNPRKESCAQHPFHLTRVNQIISGKKAYLPTVLVSLSFFDTQDRQFITFSDSCAEAAHISQEKALHSSLREFIERQSLISAWLTKQYRYKIDARIIQEIPRFNRLAQDFLHNGEIHVYDLNLALPGYATIIFYFSKSAEDFVQYAVGMAGGFSPQEALEKAINELWLDYNYLYYASDLWKDLKVIPSALRYTVRHAQDNCQQTRQKIPFDLSAPANITTQQFLKLPNINTEKALQAITQISPHVFLYHSLDERGSYHYTKILSPDFFMHMAITEKLNLNNNFMDQLGATNLNELYLETIPFP